MRKSALWMMSCTAWVTSGTSAMTHLVTWCAAHARAMDAGSGTAFPTLSSKVIRCYQIHLSYEYAGGMTKDIMKYNKYIIKLFKNSCLFQTSALWMDRHMTWTRPLRSAMTRATWWTAHALAKAVVAGDVMPSVSRHTLILLLCSAFCSVFFF